MFLEFETNNWSIDSNKCEWKYGRDIVILNMTNIKLSKNEQIYSKTAFSSYCSHFSKHTVLIFLGSYQDTFVCRKELMRFTRKMHKSGFLFLPFLRSDILKVVYGNNWTPTMLVSGASRRQTKGDFLRASASLARGRWWGWQIAANFRCAYRIAGEIAEKCSRCDREGEDFEWCVFMGLLGTWE